MATGDLTELFKSLDLSASPPIIAYEAERSRILWLMWIAHDKLKLDLLGPGQISTVLRDVFRIDIPRQRVMSLLDAESKTTVARRTKNRKRFYQIMQAGIDEIAAASPSIVFIHPEQALTQYRKVEGLLAQLEGDLRLCDPYTDRRTLDVVANCAKARSIRLLTANIKDVNALKGDLKIFAKQHGNILEVRTVPPATLHDRYLIHDKGMLLIGTSLNGLGLKQSFVVEVGEDIRTVVAGAFDSFWRKASPV